MLHSDNKAADLVYLKQRRKNGNRRKEQQKFVHDWCATETIGLCTNQDSLIEMEDLIIKKSRKKHLLFRFSGH